jgi:hypothetical protein
MVKSPDRKGDDHGTAAARDLDQAAHEELDRRYQTTRDATTRTRYQMILLRAEDHGVVEVAQLTRCSPDTVRRVLKRYLAAGPTPCRTGPTWASRPTTRPPGRLSWSGSPTWTPTRLGSTVRCGAVGCWPTTWPG